METAEKLLRWQADPHQWGPGKIHLVEETDRQKTLCGKALETCPGRYVTDLEANCQGCANALGAREKRERLEVEWRGRQLALQLERERKDQDWQERYAAYMLSPQWAWKRTLVLRRENGVCEACRENRATQVHHSTYKHVFDEPLFELHAICRDCHEKITEMDRDARVGGY